MSLPKEIIEAWENREGPAVLTTVSSDNLPNSIYATCVSLYEQRVFMVADNFFDKTRKNIAAEAKATLLFITKERKSYQVKGAITRHTEGAYFSDMKNWNRKDLPGHAVAVIEPEEIYSGAKQLM